MTHILGGGFTSKKQDTYMEGPFYYHTSSEFNKTPTQKQILEFQNQNLFGQQNSDRKARAHSASQKEFKIRNNSGQRRHSDRSSQYQHKYAQYQNLVAHQQNNNDGHHQHTARQQKLAKKHHGKFLSQLDQKQQHQQNGCYPKSIKEAYKLRDMRKLQQEQKMQKVQNQHEHNGQAEHNSQPALDQLQNQQEQQLYDRTPRKIVVKKRKEPAVAQKKPKEEIPQSIFHSEEAFKRLLIKQYKASKESGDGQIKKFKDIGVSQSLSNFLFQKNPQKSGNYAQVDSHGKLIRSQYKPGYSQKVYSDQIITSYIPCLQGETMVSPKGTKPNLKIDMYQTAASSIGFHSENEEKARYLCKTPNTRYCSTPKQSIEVQNIPMLGTSQTLGSLKEYLAQRQSSVNYQY